MDDVMPADNPKQGAIERFHLFEMMLPCTMQVVIVVNDDFRHDIQWLSAAIEEFVFGCKVRRYRNENRHYVVPDPEYTKRFMDEFQNSDLEWSYIDWYPYQSQGNA